MILARSVPVLVIAAAGCAGSSAADLPRPEAVELPAAAGSAQPHVAASGAGLIVSWVEPAAAGHALRFATWDGQRWTEPGTVAEGDDWFLNWADFPSVIALSDTEMAAHWLQRSGPGTYAYDVMLSRSQDGGATWSQPVRPHRDGTQTEHGFVSLFPHEGELGAVWLDGRKFAAAEEAGDEAAKEMTVRFATLDRSGTPLSEAVLDERACDCCQTAVALTASGPVVAYRDRSEAEVRDIAVTRLVDGAWTAPRIVHADNWVIPGCPVNGPQADAQGDVVALAWFTAADESPRVNLAFSADAGASFDAPVRIDGGDAVGRVDVLLLDEHRALVTWVERVGDGGEVRARLVHDDGRVGAPRVIATTSAQRASGFPRMARRGDDVLFTWTEPGEPSAVRGARLTIP